MVGTTGIELVTPYGYWLPEPPLKISAIFSCSTTLLAATRCVWLNGSDLPARQERRQSQGSQDVPRGIEPLFQS